MEESTRRALLSLYDTPDPTRPGSVLAGYDRDHADRTARIVELTGRCLGLDPALETDFQVASLLHDIGRAGMDPAYFARVFALAQRHGLPLRIRDLKRAYPSVPDDGAVEHFLELLGPYLCEEGISIDQRLVEHVRMRMDFKDRLREILDAASPTLDSLGITFHPWMEKVMLYYYYPTDMDREAPQVRKMGMVLLACENFEAFNNAQRGRDYYGRRQERIRDAFLALAQFEQEGLLAPEIIDCIRRLTASGAFASVIKDARGIPAGHPLPAEDIAFLEELSAGPS